MNLAASSITLIGQVDDLQSKARKKVGKFRRILFATNVLKKKQTLLLLYKQHKLIHEFFSRHAGETK